MTEIETTLNLEDYVKVFTKMREFTALSPSGTHYGQYIASYEHGVLSRVNLFFMG